MNYELKKSMLKSLRDCDIFCSVGLLFIHIAMYILVLSTFFNISETVFQAAGSPNGHEISKYRDGTISRRPPQPIPRSPNNLRHKTHSAVLDPFPPRSSSHNGTMSPGTYRVK